MSDPPIGWPNDHGPANVEAMVKTLFGDCFELDIVITYERSGVSDVFLFFPVSC